MLKQKAGWWNSGRNGSHRQGAAARPATNSLLGKISIAIVFAASCPGLLPASDLAAPRIERPKAGPALPAGIRPALTATSVTLNTLFFDFGNDLVGNKLTQTAVLVTNTGAATLSLKPTLSGDASFAIVAAKSCGATLAPHKSCDVIVSYLPTVSSYPKQQKTTLMMNFANAVAGVPASVAIQGTSAAIKTGYVSPTKNPQVALYTLTLPFPGRMQVNFGPTTAYGWKTWFQGTDVNHGVISIYVAGMRAQKTYHMAATVQLNNGIVWTDSDHKFNTGKVNAAYVFPVTVQTAKGFTPQPGIELANPLNSLQAYDLQGNLIWNYPVPTPASDYLDGAKMLPNGHILIAIGGLSNAPLFGTLGTNIVNEIREIDLAGNTIQELSVTDLNASLQTATCAECQDGAGVPLTLQTFHHDITPLPNGHWLILANEVRTLSTTTKPPLTNGSQQPVLADVVVDVDEYMRPVWVWNEFNHMDPNRQPMGFPDWTHSNGVLYSPDDGNFIISVRHQNWVMKVNYRNGRGNGDILWKLGASGDLVLKNGTAPDDWPYAQHMPHFFSPNTSGVFSLGMMDNGDDRLFKSRPECKPQSKLPTSCLYSTIPVYKIDETAKTATLTWHQKIIPANYSFFGGNTEELANGNVEYDLCGLPPTTAVGASSLVQEVTQDAEMTTVWSLYVTTANFYRAFRIPSLYPGVTWK